MIFSELYGAYYNTVACVLKAAIDHPLQKDELRRIIEAHAFGESVLSIEPALAGERWQLLRRDGTTPLKHAPSMPLTTLQKRWLKAIAADPRMRLFSAEPLVCEDVEPLFTADDYFVFDKYADGDPYADEAYIRHFRLILDAIKNRIPLCIEAKNRKETVTRLTLMPEYLEYSEKDDKFRLISSGNRFGNTVNLGRIISCERCDRAFKVRRGPKDRPCPGKVTFELFDERNALERVLLHFAHFEKEAEKLGDRHYSVTVSYDKRDETEIVIRLLSFGPMVKVSAPQHFVDLIKERLIHQKSCEQ